MSIPAYGPYNIRWITAPYGPYTTDLGLGIGLVKVRDNLSSAMPFCPAMMRVDPRQDPELIAWQEQSGNQSTKGLDPELPICEELVRESREWHHHVLRTRYRLGETAVVQQLVVGRASVHARLEAEAPVELSMGGESFGPCKLRLLPDGIHVIEGGLRLKPLEYHVRFSVPPSRVTCGGEPLSEERFRSFDDQVQWSIAWDEPVETLEIAVPVGRSFVDGVLPLEATGDFRSELHRQAEEWERYFAEDVPALSTPEPRLDELQQYLAWVFRSNTIHGGGILPYPYSIPKYTFCGWWMWDTAKSAIAGAWYGQRHIAWGGLLNTENLQYPEPHNDAGVITNSARYHGVDVWHSPDASSSRFYTMPFMIPEEHGSGTHPPMFALALWSLWTVDGDDARMSRLLPNVLAFDAYFDRCRASETVPGLILVRRWSDSGMDNSKRWANQNNRALAGHIHHDDVDWEMPVISVDVNVYSIREKRCLAEMCRAAGLEAKAERLSKQAAEREDILHRELWDEERGLYIDRDEARGQFISVIAPTSLSPLMLDDLPAERLPSLLRWLFDPEHFWSPYPIPSISMADPDFQPERGYWMGPVWMSYPMDILRGLFKHDRGAAHKLLDRLLALMMKDGIPAAYENYHPLTGQALECPNFSWPGQLTDILLRDMFGIAWRDGELHITSHGVPDDWDHWSLRNLQLHGRRFAIDARRRDGHWHYDIRQL